MRYVVIGASAAGVTAIKRLRKLDPASSITVVSSDRQVYSRCMLHLRLGGGRDMKGISFIDEEFFADNRIAWMRGESVIDIDIDAKEVKLESGVSVPYDKLLIASGASSFIPPVPNLRYANNVMTLRTIDDVRALELHSASGARAVVIGAGLVGMDAAVGLLERGVKVTMVEMADRVLSIQLDDYAANRYADLLWKNGVEVITGARVLGAVTDGSGGVCSVQLEGGRELPCDFCMVAAGVAPNIGFIKDERLCLTENKRAVAVNRRCQTSVPEIYAAGDVTFLAPIWPEAVRQAEVAATNMTGGDASLPEQDWAWTNSMNFFDLPTVSYGHTSIVDPSFNQDVYLDGDVYKKVIHKDGVIHGVIFQGDIDNCGVYLRLVRDKIPVGDIGTPLHRLSYADFFEQAANGEFV
jgi:NAD(P)H-nitrite reductase